MNRRTYTALLALAACCLLIAWLARPSIARQNNGRKALLEGRGKGGESEGEDERDDVRGREEWFYRLRRYPLAHIPAGLRNSAWERKEAMRRALRERMARGPVMRSPLATGLWTSIGPMPTLSATGAGLVSGRVTAIATDPTNANIVFVAGAQGGVWKSTDAGAHWTPTFDGEQTLAIGSLAIDPSSCAPGPCTTLYAGTGEQNFSGDSYYGAGVYKSTDGGNTWGQIPGEAVLNPQAGAPTSFLPPAAPFNQAVGGVHIGAMVVHPSAPARLFAAVQIFENVGGGASSGLYCSEDGGNSWWQELSGAIGTDVAIHPNGTTGYAALGSNNGDTDPRSTTGQNGVFKSTNVNAPCASQTWTLISKTPVPLGTNAGTIRLGLAPSDASANTLYAAVANPIATVAPFNTTLAGVFKTLNGGMTWTTVSPMDFCKNQCDYDLALKVHPTDANTVIAGGSAVPNGNQPFFLLRTNNGGTTWTQIAQDANGTLIHVDQHAIAFGFNGAAVTSLFVGNDGGIWSSPLPTPSSAVTWTDLNATLQLSQYYPGMSIDPRTPALGLGGTQDNGTQRYDTISNASNPQQWTEQPVCGDGGYTAIDPTAPNVLYAACQNIDINKSVNGGASYTSSDNGIAQSDRAEFIPPLVMDAANPNRLYFGTFRVWQTTNGAANWAAISPDLTAGPTNSPDITSVSVSPVNGDVVYAATLDSRLWRTTNASAGTGALSSWIQIDGGTLPPRAITQVVADPNNQDVAFVTTSGFSGFQINPPATDTQGHVFRCFALLLSCADISGSGSGALPNTPVNALVVDPIDALSETLYIGTDVGVFASADGGMTWLPDFPATPPAANGLPNVAVLSLTLQPAARILRAGTHGRGAWDLQLSSVAPLRLASVNPGAVTVTATNATVTLNGSGFTVQSTVLFNGVTHAATVLSPTQILVNLTASDLAAVGTISVLVSDSTGGLSNTTTFAVTNDFGFCAAVVAGTSCPATGSAAAPRGVAVSTTFTVVPAVAAAYPASVVFSCAGLPAQSSCSFNPTSLPAAAGAAGNSSLTVTFNTTAPSQLAPTAERRGPEWPSQFALRAARTALVFALLLALIAARRARRTWQSALAVALILAGGVFFMACGGGGNSSSGGGGTGNPGTPQGTYAITVTATSGSVVHSVTFNLTVQ